MNLKSKILAGTLSLAVLLTSATPSFAAQQDIKIKQKVTKHGIKQKIVVKQIGDLNEALAQAAINADIPNSSKNFKIKQEIKIKQKGNYNDAVVNPTINANLGNKTQNIKIKQKVKIKQKGKDNSASV